MDKESTQLAFGDEKSQADNEPVICLGMTFKNDEERREYFREELRKKLPDLKEIEGFPIGEDEDIIELSDPPYYTACPNPWMNDFIEEWEKEKVQNYGNSDNYNSEPFAADVSEGKYDPLYKLHPYPTKVPHKAIMRYILHYTNPGDIIFDGFSGTGTTGVAAQQCGNKEVIESLGYKVKDNEDIYLIDSDNKEEKFVSKLGERKTILNDLSSIASFISYNYNIPEKDKYKKNLELIKKVEEETNWMYHTIHTSNQKEEILKRVSGLNSVNDAKKNINSNNNCFGKINYTVWSDVFICPNCNEEIVFWKEAVNKERGKVKKEFHCKECNKLLKKNDLLRAKVSFYDSLLDKVVEQSKQVPVLINYSYSTKRYEKVPDEYDLKILSLIENINPEYWLPTYNLKKGYNTTQPIVSHQFTNVHHFYSKRNLLVLGMVKSFGDFSDIGFSLTRVATQITKLYRYTYQSGTWGAGGGPLSGTLYIPSLIKELPILKQLKSAVKQQFSKEGNFKIGNVINGISSTTEMSSIADNTIDYIFIDPPFGSNLMYSEINLLWEAWLKIFTNDKEETIVNPYQNKGINEYKSLIVESLKEIYRILKPGKWITVEFSNTSSDVWNSIQNALQEVGFIIANVSVLDKKKGSFKAVTSTIAVKQDLVISAYKPEAESIKFINEQKNTEESAWAFVTQHLERLPVFNGQKGEAQLIAERTPRILYDRMIAYHVQNGLPVPLSSADFQTSVLQRYPVRDGMAFLESQVAEYDKKRTLVKEFTQLSLFVSDENSAIEWIRQQLMKKPQTRQDIHPAFMKEIQHIAKHEMLPELDDLLNQNFLRYDGAGPVPNQILTYLRRTYKDLRGLDPTDTTVVEKAMHRWYVPDPNKQADLEKLRERALLREYDGYLQELEGNKKKLKTFRTEAIRAGFKKAYSDNDFESIVKVGERIPEKVIQEDDKLLMYYDNACIRLGL
ncbi:DNA methyltransferase [Bacillus sp. FSL R5-0394]